MAYIRYEIDPKDPSKTEANRNKAYLHTFIGFVLVFASLFAIFHFISSLSNIRIQDSFFSLITISLVSFLDVLPFFISSKNKKTFIKIYLIFLLSSIALLISTIGIVYSAVEEKHSLLTISIISIPIVIFISIVSIAKIKKIALITHIKTDSIQTENRNHANNKQFFCYRCGGENNTSANFCSFCGISLKK